MFSFQLQKYIFTTEDLAQTYKEQNKNRISHLGKLLTFGCDFFPIIFLYIYSYISIIESTHYMQYYILLYYKYYDHFQY